jgi:hypothetical protein
MVNFLKKSDTITAATQFPLLPYPPEESPDTETAFLSTLILLRSRDLSTGIG